MIKPKLFLDMDNVLVDTLSILNTADPTNFNVAKPDQIPGIFRSLPPVPDAISAVNQLAEHFDLYILSTAPWQNPSAWSDKILWLTQYFGAAEDSVFYKKVVMTHDKSLAKANGGILIDDRPYHGASGWDDAALGTAWVQYGFDAQLTWSSTLVQLLIDTANYYQAHDVTLRAALEAANASRFQLQGPVETFAKAHWE
ncbi:hypothetical protein EQG49_11910 [Periweissella cryptocerci]|uniref:Uncharacterized protein n=1 Tax=Periweissella cryptocerci TaxID=2506420 RepID=A0A4P6YW47_9LACO|nr:hypothetical protein [Periweissella cryptocerci]QBO37109.1 hypothetical protein EQG49_11910 [Periweissella cryptocerci]